MTMINMLIPIVGLDKATNNPQIIRRVLKDKYPYLSIDNIYWINDQENEQSKQIMECVVKVKNMSVDLDELVSTFQQKRSLEQSLIRLKHDIFNMVEQLKILEFSRDSLKLSRLKQENNNIVQDISLSMKLQQRNRRQNAEGQDLYVKQLTSAISDLTKENIKLKDAVQYYKIQIQALLKPNKATDQKNK